MNICKCGIVIPNKKAKRCRSCWKESIKFNCLDCKKDIRKNQTGRCRDCYYKYLRRPRNCQSCNKLIEYRGCSKELCISCYRKDERKRKGEEINLWHRNYRRRKNGIDESLPNLRDGSMGSIDKRLGYKTIIAHGHPNAMGKKGRILEHVYVMSEYLGRPLMKGETVHHKNGIRDDNRIENLELWDKSQPSGQRVEDKIEFYKEFLIRHGYIIKKE